MKSCVSSAIEVISKINSAKDESGYSTGKHTHTGFKHGYIRLSDFKYLTTNYLVLIIAGDFYLEGFALSFPFLEELKVVPVLATTLYNTADTGFDV